MYEIFEKLCRGKGVTPYRVCKETGLTTATISNWKAGRYMPKSDKMKRIAEYFDVSLDYLMGTSFIEEMGHVIQEERLCQGVSQEDLSAELGISVPELDAYESQDKPIREDIFESILFALGTTYTELMFKYDLYDEYIPPHFNGDVVRYEAFKRACDKDAEAENSYPPFIAQNDTERRLLLLCRKAGDATEGEREAILNNFEATIDMYLKAKGIKKE